jgi:hypothetical protein
MRTLYSRNMKLTLGILALIPSVIWRHSTWRWAPRFPRISQVQHWLHEAEHRNFTPKSGNELIFFSTCNINTISILTYNFSPSVRSNLMTRGIYIMPSFSFNKIKSHHSTFTPIWLIKTMKIYAGTTIFSLITPIVCLRKGIAIPRWWTMTIGSRTTWRISMRSTTSWQGNLIHVPEYLYVKMHQVSVFYELH